MQQLDQSRDTGRRSCRVSAELWCLSEMNWLKTKCKQRFVQWFRGECVSVAVSLNDECIILSLGNSSVMLPKSTHWERGQSYRISVEVLKWKRVLQFPWLRRSPNMNICVLWLKCCFCCWVLIFPLYLFCDFDGRFQEQSIKSWWIVLKSFSGGNLRT